MQKNHMQISRQALSQAIDTIKISGLFDEQWYKRQYWDVILANMDAAEHYARIGWRLGRNPGPNFNTSEYLSRHPTLKSSLTCPLVHFESERNNQITATGSTIERRESDQAAKRRAEIAVVAQSRLFDAEWYRASHPEVDASGLDPAEHYLARGAALLLNPGPGFSTRFYLQKHPDIGKAGANPLTHYEKFGRAEGRAILPAYLDKAETDPSVIASTRAGTRAFWNDPTTAESYLARQLGMPMPGEPLRMVQTFDAEQTERFVSALTLCSDENEKDQTLVSVIMPTYNRALKISAAIDSVLRQSWRNFELLVVDDGSHDNTLDVLNGYNDSRIHILHSAHGGVSVARNEGLRHAKGDVLFYLDSDNQWTPDFLWNMMDSMRHSGAACGYAGTRLQSHTGTLIGYRGEPFDWEACLALNYVDMNVFCHRRDFLERLGGFDTGLRRMVDWDLILRFTRGEQVFYAPFIGCIYLEDSFDMQRITTSQPIVSRKLVHNKNALNCTLQQAAATLRLSIAIKIFAPHQDRNAWGDYHYAESLAKAFEALGHRVRIDFRGQWYDKPIHEDDVAIVLRGLEAYRPRPTQINLLWVISHPDTVTPEEYAGYHGIFVASRSHAELLEILLRRPVETMWQCTDADRFFPPSEEMANVHGERHAQHGLFVGNSRREYRQVVRWAVEAELPLDVIGQDWEDYLPKTMIRTTNAPNTELAGLYGSASFVLNDHWPSMRDFGYISNRVFDVLAAGGRLISDKIDSIESLLGRAVVMASSADELKQLVESGAMTRDAADRQRMSDHVRHHHSFLRRAEAFDHWIRRHIAPGFQVSQDINAALPALQVDHWGDRIRVGILALWSAPQSVDNAIERLVAPLTSDAAATRVRLVRVETPDELRGAEIDILVVAADDIVWSDALATEVRARAQQGLPIFVDSLSDTLPNGLSLIELAGLWRGTAVAPDGLSVQSTTIQPTLDPRLWRLYRSPRTIETASERRRLLIVCAPGQETQTAERAAALMAGALADAPVSLRLVGAVMDAPPSDPRILCQPWPEGSVGYAQRARWLLDHVTADFGVVFGDTLDSEGQMLRMMALGVIPVMIAPAVDSLARSAAMSEGVIVCETEEDFAAMVQKDARSATDLLTIRHENRERIWRDHNSLQTPNMRLAQILKAYESKATA